MRFYGMLSIADTFEEINKFSQNTINYGTGTKNICFCRENAKFYESNGGNYFECSEINSILKTQQIPLEVSNVPLPLAPQAPIASTGPTMPMLIIEGQEMDLQTFANETVDTLRILSNFKLRFENICNGGQNNGV